MVATDTEMTVPLRLFEVANFTHLPFGSALALSCSDKHKPRCFCEVIS